jgi:hypothetical protein
MLDKYNSLTQLQCEVPQRELVHSVVFGQVNRT